MLDDLFRQDDGRTVRYGVVGLGWIAQQAVLPAFRHAESSELAALVSDDPQKLRELGDEYGVAHRYTYADYDTLLTSGLIDAVFIALPNAMHRDYTVRAANAGIHILCEKPLANTSADSRAMIAAARAANVQLMTAYRLHFEEATLRAIEIVQSGEIGGLRAFNANHMMQVQTGNVRLDGPLSGGPLEDVGIYCINAARHLFQAEPIQVTAFAASTDNPRFDEVHETVSAILRFPDHRLATFTCSFGAAEQSYYQVIGTQGDVLVTPGFSFDKEITSMLTVDGKRSEKRYGRRDQFAAELTHFSQGILSGEPVEPSGEEGLNDVLIIEAIHESIRQGMPITLDVPQRAYQPTMAQMIRHRAGSAPDLVNAEGPKAGK